MKSLAQRMIDRRAFGCELEPAADGRPAKVVRMLRPPETHMLRLAGGVTLEDVIGAGVGWEGFSEDDLLGGNGIGSSDPAPFSTEAWRELVVDSIEYAGKASKALTAAVTAHIDRIKAASGN